MILNFKIQDSKIFKNILKIYLSKQIIIIFYHKISKILNRIFNPNIQFNKQHLIYKDLIILIAIKNPLNPKAMYFSNNFNHFKNYKICNFQFNKNLFNNFLGKRNKDKIFLLHPYETWIKTMNHLIKISPRAKLDFLKFPFHKNY